MTYTEELHDYTTSHYTSYDYTYYSDPLTISYQESVKIEYKGWSNLLNKRSYTFSRIMTPSDYLAKLEEYECDFYVDLESVLSGYQYVLNFYETDWGQTASLNFYKEEYTEVCDVAVFRLFFDVDGVSYDLGVVSNRVTQDPDNYYPSGVVTKNTGESVNCGSDFWNTVLTVVLIIALVLIIVVLWPVWKLLAKFIVWLFTWPFTAYKKHKEKKRQKEAQAAQQAMIESSKSIENASRSLENSVNAVSGSGVSAANGRENDPDYKAVLEYLQRMLGDGSGTSGGSTPGDDKK